MISKSFLQFSSPFIPQRMKEGKEFSFVRADFEMPATIWSWRMRSLLGEQIWELSAIKAKEMDGVTQSTQAEGKEAEVRHWEDRQYTEPTETEKRHKKEPSRFLTAQNTVTLFTQNIAE